MELREATPDDLDAVTNIVIAAMPADPAWAYRCVHRDSYPDDHRQAVKQSLLTRWASEDSYIHIVVKDGQPIACLSWEKSASPLPPMHHRRDVDPAHFTALAQASMRLRQRADARYPKRYHAKVFATHPAFQGLGAGALLLRYVMQEAANDATPLTLWSASPAKALYTHFGFTVLASDKAQAPGEDHGVDVFAMCYEA